MSAPVSVLVAASAATATIIAFVALNLLRQFRLRRHLHRLRTMPVEQFGGR